MHLIRPVLQSAITQYHRPGADSRQAAEQLMPWCDDCAKYWAQSAMTPAGRCPTCDRELDAAGVALDDQDAERAPSHVKMLVVALVVYLVWRFFRIFFG